MSRRHRCRLRDKRRPRSAIRILPDNARLAAARRRGATQSKIMIAQRGLLIALTSFIPRHALALLVLHPGAGSFLGVAADLESKR
jgi:hypothetical protein